MSDVKNFFDSASNLPSGIGAAAHGSSIRPARKDHVHPGWNLEQLLFYKRAVDMNATTDQALTRVWDFTAGKVLLSRILVNNASVDLTAADGGVYTAASKGGIAVVANTQVYTALTGATLGMLLTLTAAGLDELDLEALYVSLTGAQGGAATADFWVFGTPINIA